MSRRYARTSDKLSVTMKFPTIIASFLFFVFSCVVHAQSSSSDIALLSLPGGFLSVQAVIGDHQGTFLFDSGSGVSSITPEFAAKIGCKPWGQISGLRMTGKRLDMRRCDNVSVRLGTYQSKTGTIGVFDLGKVLPPSLGGIDGTIALDLFVSQSLCLSYSRHVLQVLGSGILVKSVSTRRSVPNHIVRDA